MILRDNHVSITFLLPMISLALDAYCLLQMWDIIKPHCLDLGVGALHFCRYDDNGKGVITNIRNISRGSTGGFEKTYPRGRCQSGRFPSRTRAFQKRMPVNSRGRWTSGRGRSSGDLKPLSSNARNVSELKYDFRSHEAF